MLWLWIVIGVVVVFILFPFIATYNGLVRLRNQVKNAWAQIDVQLKRRYDLIPNLMETVKGYVTHEQSLLEEITRLRSQSQSASAVSEKAKLESALGRSLSGLIAVAENYPDLKAAANFSELQGQLAEIEDQIQMARRYYNGAVRTLNIKVESFPGNLVAGRFGFQTAEFFEIESPEERSLPKVRF